MPTIYPEPTVDKPSVADIEDWIFDSVAYSTDGCQVEPDGICEHHYPSWLIYLGLI